MNVGGGKRMSIDRLRVLAEGEGESLHTWVEELDLEIMVSDRAGLPDELVQPLFRHDTLAGDIAVGAVVITRWRPVD
jgi:hypothetical protein